MLDNPISDVKIFLSNISVQVLDQIPVFGLGSCSCSSCIDMKMDIDVDTYIDSKIFGF
jgi:hypothetical protein